MAAGEGEAVLGEQGIERPEHARDKVSREFLESRKVGVYDLISVLCFA